MKKLMTLFGAILFASFILSSCGGSSSKKQVNEENSTQYEKPKVNEENSTQYEKPKLCDCKNYLFKDVEDGMNYGKIVFSDFSKECEKFYTVEELIDANCGFTKYDPNFKAK